MKRILCFCIVILLLVGVTGCSAASGAVKAFETAMETMKQEDELNIRLDSLLKDILSENKEELKTKLSQLVLASRYKVDSVTEREDGTVQLAVQVTAIDGAAVINQFVAAMMELVSSAEYQATLDSMSKQEYHTVLVSSMLSVLEEELPSAEKTVDVVMVKDKDGWRMEDEAIIVQTIFSNLVNAVTSLV